jgi:hypothetical protein
MKDEVEEITSFENEGGLKINVTVSSTTVSSVKSFTVITST